MSSVHNLLRITQEYGLEIDLNEPVGLKVVDVCDELRKNSYILSMIEQDKAKNKSKFDEIFKMIREEDGFIECKSLFIQQFNEKLKFIVDNMNTIFDSLNEKKANTQLIQVRYKNQRVIKDLLVEFNQDLAQFDNYVKFLHDLNDDLSNLVSYDPNILSKYDSQLASVFRNVNEAIESVLLFYHRFHETKKM